MYSLLRKRTINSSPFTANYFTNHHLPDGSWLPPETNQWTNAHSDIVLTDQDNIAGTLEISYEDIFPEIVTDETILYNTSSQILQYKQEYENASAAIPIAEQETIAAQGAYEEAVEAYEAYEALYITPKENIIAECKADKQKQQADIDAANALIAGLNLEEDSEGKTETINFLRALIRAAEAAIDADNNTINYNQTAIDTLKTSEEYVNAKSLKESTYATWQAKRQAEQTARNAADAAYNRILAAINEWNTDLNTVKTYITILLQVNELHNIPLSDLQEQINHYRSLYTTLVNKHTTEKNNANNSVYEITSLQIAFNKLNTLRTEWAARLAELDSIINNPPIDPGEPIAFTWTQYINNIKEAWENFINLLQQAYQAREEVYYQ